MKNTVTDSPQAAIGRYFDGHATGSSSVMREAFHESARVQFVKDGRYSVWALDEYLGKLPGRPADDESARTRRIVGVHVIGDIASAEVELDYPATRFVDHLTLLRIDGQWLIVNKAFQAFPKTGAQS